MEMKKYMLKIPFRIINQDKNKLHYIIYYTVFYVLLVYFLDVNLYHVLKE